MDTLDLDTAIVGQRKLRHLGESAGILQEHVIELLEAEEFPGHEATVEAARKLQDRIRWVLGEPELEHKFARVGHLLDHGVRVVETLLDATTHEHEDVDVARGWMRRVDEHKERLSRGG